MEKSEQKRGREFLKSRWPDLATAEVDRKSKVPLPPMQQPADEGNRIALRAVDELIERFKGVLPLTQAIAARETRRSHSSDPISLDELAYLLWACQGVRKQTPKASFRTVPSGGARHPFETFLMVQRVTGVAPGLYRYLPLEHQLVLEKSADEFDNDPDGKLDEALMKHNFNAAATFLWAAVPYRSEWSYAHEAARLILLDAGHVCQNLYLACEAVDCGTCAVGAYDQEKIDALVGLDGVDEFIVYAAPVGKKKTGESAG